MLYTITGPSGSGKTTLVRLLTEQFPKRFKKVVTSTTRKPRKGETDGEDYFFESRPAGGFAEWSESHAAPAEFDGNFYGICDRSMSSGDGADLLVIVEPSGARELAARHHGGVKTVYIGVSAELAARRMKKRRSCASRRASSRQKADMEAGLYNRDGYDVILENDGSLESLVDGFLVAVSNSVTHG